MRRRNPYLDGQEIAPFRRSPFDGSTIDAFQILGVPAPEASRSEVEARLVEAAAQNVIAPHPAALQRCRELIVRLAPVLSSGDAAELVCARTEGAWSRRESDETPETKTAALMAQDGRFGTWVRGQDLNL